MKTAFSHKLRPSLEKEPRLEAVSKMYRMKEAIKSDPKKEKGRRLTTENKH